MNYKPPPPGPQVLGCLTAESLTLFSLLQATLSTSAVLNAMNVMTQLVFPALLFLSSRLPCPTAYWTSPLGCLLGISNWLWLKFPSWFLLATPSPKPILLLVAYHCSDPNPKHSRRLQFTPIDQRRIHHGAHEAWAYSPFTRTEPLQETSLYVQFFYLSYRRPSDCVKFQLFLTWICLCTLRPAPFPKGKYLNQTTLDTVDRHIPGHIILLPGVLSWPPHAPPASSLPPTISYIAAKWPFITV